MKPTICITEKEYIKSAALFDGSTFECVAVGSAEDTLAAAVRQHQSTAVIVGVDAYTGPLYDVLPSGSVIARYGVGHDNIDKDLATQAGIIVTNTPLVLDVSVAEHAMWLIGALARNITGHHQEMIQQHWLPRIGMELAGKRLLILGCGGIGSMVARKASFGFGMEVIGFDIAGLDADHMKAEYGISRLIRSVEQELPQVDFVSVHLPSIEATRHYIDKHFLSQMKPSAYLINTARGSLVDEVALYQAIKGGTIAGAGLDVYETEPYQPRDPEMDLRRLENVVLTPHIATSTRAACRRMGERALKNIAAVLAQDYHALDIVNPSVLEKLR
ncbi:MAG: hypothetical protein JW936_03210 [Sedimentisphaerales bacterium]|nr:hypothetical protein [Sedimentisphaerales bacterium]